MAEVPRMQEQIRGRRPGRRRDDHPRVSRNVTALGGCAPFFGRPGR